MPGRRSRNTNAAAPLCSRHVEEHCVHASELALRLGLLLLWKCLNTMGGTACSCTSAGVSFVVPLPHRLCRSLHLSLVNVSCRSQRRVLFCFVSCLSSVLSSLGHSMSEELAHLMDGAGRCTGCTTNSGLRDTERITENLSSTLRRGHCGHRKFRSSSTGHAAREDLHNPQNPTENTAFKQKCFFAFDRECPTYTVASHPFSSAPEIRFAYLICGLISEPFGGRREEASVRFCGHILECVVCRLFWCRNSQVFQCTSVVIMCPVIHNAQLMDVCDSLDGGS